MERTTTMPNLAKMAIIIAVSLAFIVLGVSTAFAQSVTVTPTTTTGTDGDVDVSGSCETQDASTTADLFFGNEGDSEPILGATSVSTDSEGDFSTNVDVPEPFQTGSSTVILECQSSGSASFTMDFFAEPNGTTTPPENGDGDGNGTTTPPANGDNGQGGIGGNGTTTATTTVVIPGNAFFVPGFGFFGTGGIGGGDFTQVGQVPTGAVAAGAGGAESNNSLNMVIGASMLAFGLLGLRRVRQRMELK